MRWAGWAGLAGCRAQCVGQVWRGVEGSAFGGVGGWWWGVERSALGGLANASGKCGVLCGLVVWWAGGGADVAKRDVVAYLALL